MGWTLGEALYFGVEATRSGSASVFGRSRGATERHAALAPLAAAGDFACVDPNEPAAHGRIVAVRADGPGRATLVRLMAVEVGRSVLRAANLGRPDMEMTRANETTIGAVVMFVGRAGGLRRKAPSLPDGSVAERFTRDAVSHGNTRESGSDGALSRPGAQQRQG